jgi:chromosomal replication initiator protein
VPTPDDIIEETAKYYGLTAADLKGQSRTRNTTLARQIAMYQIRRLTNLSLQDIGAMFEGRDHSTVLTSIKKIEGNMTEELSQTIKDITANINARG